MSPSPHPRSRLTKPRSALLLAAGIIGIMLGLWLISAFLMVLPGSMCVFVGATLSSLSLHFWLQSAGLRSSASFRIDRPGFLAAVALGCILLIRFLYKLDSLEHAHGDEIFWMPISQRSFQLFFIEGRYADPWWSTFDNAFLGYHPVVAKFLIGAALWVADIPSIPFQQVEWTQSIAWNLEHGLKLDLRALAIARLPAALSAVIAGLTVFWIGNLLDSWGLGLLAGLGFLSSSIVLVLGQRVMLDMPTLCFSLLTVASIFEIIRALRAGRIATHWAVMAGIWTGLAIGSKLIALIISLPACWLLLYEAERFYSRCTSRKGGFETRPLRLNVALLYLLTIAIWTGLVFFVLNPLLYRQPWHGLYQMYSFMGIVQQTPYSPTHTPAARFMALWQSLGVPGLGRLGLPGGNVLVLAGAVLMLRRQRRPQAADTHILDSFLLWSTVVFLLLLVTLPANIDRYLLPLQPIAAILQAYALLAVWRGLRQVSRKGQI